MTAADAYLTGSITTNGGMEINNGGLDINNGGLYVEGNVTFDDTLYQKAYIRAVPDGGPNCGASGNRWDEVWAVTGTIQTSDATLKTDIKPIEHGVDFILGLNPVQYKLIVGDSNRPHHGFIAQEVKQVMDNLGIDFAGYIDPTINPDTDNGTPDVDSPMYNKLSLRYEEFIAPLVQTIQSLEQRIKDLEARLAPSV